MSFASGVAVGLITGGIVAMHYGALEPQGSTVFSAAIGGGVAVGLGAMTLGFIESEVRRQ